MTLGCLLLTRMWNNSNPRGWCKMIHPLWKSLTVSYQVKHTLIIWPNNSPLTISSREMKNMCTQIPECQCLFALFTNFLCSQFIHNSFIHNCPNWKQPTCPSTVKWISKLRYVHTMEYSLAIKGTNDSYTQHGWNSKAIC